MRPDQPHPERRDPARTDDPLLAALAGLDPAASDPGPAVGSDRHRSILEHAMSTHDASPAGGAAHDAPAHPPTSLDLGATHDEPPGVYPVAPQPKRRGGPGRLAVGIAAILSVFAGGFAINALTQPDGASSPEAAVEALFDAIADEDVIGVAEALDPAERKALVPAVEELADELERTELASGDLDLGGVDGVDLTVEGLDLRTTPLGDGVTTVEIVGGELRGDGDLAQLPVGSVIEDLIERDRQRTGENPDTIVDDTVDLSGLQLVTRKVDGGWHVSLLYTLAELARNEMEPVPAPPAYGQGIAPVGADSPEAAVRGFVDAAVAVDVQRMIELLAPGEGDVFHDYGPILVAESADAGPSDVVIEELELSVGDVSGGRAVVTPARYRVVQTWSGGSNEWAFDGECSTVTSTWEYEDFYDEAYTTGYGEAEGFGEGSSQAPDPVTPGSGSDGGSGEPTTQTSSSCDQPDDLFSLFPFLFLTDIDGGSLEVVTEEHDGRWYVSPVSTVLATVLGSVADQDADSLRFTLNWMTGDEWLGHPAEFWEACGVPQPSADVDPDTGNDAVATCWDSLPEDYEGPYGVGSMWAFGPSSEDSSGSYESSEGILSIGPDSRCYELHDGTPEGSEQALACIEELVASGELYPSSIEAFRCSLVYDQVDGVLSEEEWQVVDQAWQSCMVAAGLIDEPVFEDTEPDDPGTTATTIVAGETSETSEG